jgi:hypothetical protein
MRLHKLYNRAACYEASAPNDGDQQTVLYLLGWETFKTQKIKPKAK